MLWVQSVIGSYGTVQMAMMQEKIEERNKEVCLHQEYWYARSLHSWLRKKILYVTTCAGEGEVTTYTAGVFHGVHYREVHWRRNN